MEPNTKASANQEDYKLTAKQIEYALSLIAKLNGEYVLAVDPSQLTLKDLNRLIGYNRYKNKGILVNLAKKGVLRKEIQTYSPLETFYRRSYVNRPNHIFLLQNNLYEWTAFYLQ